MAEAPERPDAGGGWLPPAPPGPQPGPPSGWRISPRAVDTAPDAHVGPQPWADPGNSVAGVGLGLSVAAFGLLVFGLGIVALPLAVVSTILSAVGRGRIKRAETRHGKVEVSVGLAVGVATLILAAVAVAAYLVSR